MEEVWKDIEGFENVYQVSNMGRVRSLKKGKVYIFKTYLDTHGYPYVLLYVGRENGRMKHFKTHRLVAKAFCDGYAKGMVVDHLDGDKTNNVWTNLEWVTSGENNRRAYATGLKSRILSPKMKEVVDRNHAMMSKKIKAFLPNGETMTFSSANDAGKHFRITGGGVMYNVKNNKTNRKGIKFVLA